MDLPIWQAVLLGALQGLTEFLPISSSGHLAVVQHYLPGFREPGVLFDVVLHAGTLAAVLIYFAGDLKALLKNIFRQQGERGEGDPGWRLLIGLILASFVTGIVGLVFLSRIEALFQSMQAVGAGLLTTAALLLLADLILKRAGLRKPEDPGVLQSLVIGLAQGIALIPGISRSGATITAGIATGVESQRAVRFSFLLFIPAALAALVVSALRHASAISQFNLDKAAGYLLGAVMAMAVGYLCIDLLLRAVKKGRLSYFAIYCGLLGATVIFLGD
jgi:undecaprenyl-diphosphatase